MKTAGVLFMISLLSGGLCDITEVPFTAVVPFFNYSFQGFAFADLGVSGWLGTTSKISIPFNGSFRDAYNNIYTMSGEVTAEKPFLFHISKIHLKGVINADNTIEFEGKLKVEFFDLFKSNMPFSGTMRFNNGEEVEVNGTAEKSGL